MRSVLIIDDDLIYVRLLAKGLIAAGIDPDNINITTDGSAIVDVVVKTNPEVILVDFNMPIINGLEIAHRIKNSTRVEAKLILVTSEEPAILRDNAIASGFLYVVQKAGLKPTIRSILTIAGWD